MPGRISARERIADFTVLVPNSLRRVSGRAQDTTRGGLRDSFLQGPVGYLASLMANVREPVFFLDMQLRIGEKDLPEKSFRRDSHEFDRFFSCLP
jgi:hypothetical protein